MDVIASETSWANGRSLRVADVGFCVQGNGGFTGCGIISFALLYCRVAEDQLI